MTHDNMPLIEEALIVTVVEGSGGERSLEKLLKEHPDLVSRFVAFNNNPDEREGAKRIFVLKKGALEHFVVVDKKPPTLPQFSVRERYANV